MASVGAYQAKTHLPALLRRVAKGERITITKHGKAVAVLAPPTGERNRDPREVVTELRAFRKRHRLGRLSLTTLIREGRR